MTAWPKLTRNFIYWRPSIRSMLRSPSALLPKIMKLLVTRDLFVAATMSRDFCMHQVQLHPSEFPPVTVICLSTGDNLVPADLVQNQIRLQRETRALDSADQGASSNEFETQVVTYSTPHGGCLVDDELQSDILHKLAVGLKSVYGNRQTLCVDLHDLDRG